MERASGCLSGACVSADLDLTVIRIDPRPPGGLKGIMRATAADHGVEVEDLFSVSRGKAIVRVRWDFMWRARQVKWPDGAFRYSLPQIAQALGGMDHTTVLHGVREFEKLQRQSSTTNDYCVEGRNSNSQRQRQIASELLA